MINIFCHWEYLINFLFGSINRGMTHATIELPERIDESGNPDKCTSDDAVFAIFVLERPINFHESWQRLANSVEYDNAFRFQWLERS
jgi:predicted dehydrogenase